MKRSPFLLAAISAFIVVGCGGSFKTPKAKETESMNYMPPAVKKDRADHAGLAEVAIKPPAAAAEAQAGQVPVQRRIKYTADIRLISDDFTQSHKQLMQSVSKFKGYIAHSDVSQSPGSTKVGTWRIRVPVADFQAFCDEVLQLGEAQKNSTDSEDMTEKYADLQSHIKNRVEHRNELAKLRDKGGDIKYLTVLYRDISAVQLEIDSIQGQIRLLENLTDLTTVNVTIQEKQKYIKDLPPETAEKPSFGTRIGKTFQDSTEALVDFGENLAVGVVAVTPWLPIVLVVGVPIFLVVRGRWRAVAVAKEVPLKTPAEPSDPGPKT